MSSWYGQQYVDPSELEARFSIEQGLGSVDSILTELPGESELLLDRVREIMDSLPPREADMLSMYVFHNMNQTVIARIFGVSQPTICYRLQRAIARIRYLFEMPVVDLVQMEKDLYAHFEDGRNVQILMMMLETTCQSEVAKRIGETQGFVRHRFLGAIQKMRKVEGMEDYVELFEYVRDHPNILREIRRSSDEDAMLCIID